MKKWLKGTGLGLLLLSVSCSTDMRISKLSPGLEGASLTQVAFLRLSPSAYPMLHTIAGMRNKDVSSVAQQALENTLAKKRKAWKLVNSTNIITMDPTFPDRMVRLKEGRGTDTVMDTSDLMAMHALRQQLSCRYLVLLESIALKDASSAQLPGALVCGAWIQLWDLEQGSMLYRARNVTRPLSYTEKDFDQRLQEGLEDLFAEMVRPLPKQ